MYVFMGTSYIIFSLSVLFLSALFYVCVSDYCKFSKNLTNKIIFALEKNWPKTLLLFGSLSVCSKIVSETLKQE